MNNAKKWDELDFLFNRAKLKNINIHIAKKERLRSILEIDSIFKKNNFKYFLNEPTNHIFEDSADQVFEDSFVVIDVDIQKIKQVFNGTEFQIVNVDLHKLWLLNNSRIYKVISLEKKNLESELVNFSFQDRRFLLIKKSKTKNTYKKNYLNYIKLYYLNKFKKKISEKTFLKLRVEAESSKSWILRKPHLDLVTDSGKNKKVYEIVNYFSDKNNLISVQKKVIETPTDLIFEEPLYANKNFWNSGNNFFIYPLLYGFKKDVVSYKDANIYISNKNKPNIYSKKYYEDLISMTDDEIKLFLRNNPIEIANNSIVSGKHRAFAMIGRLAHEKKYINFYAKYI